MKEWGEVCWAEGEMWAMVIRGRHSIVGSAWLERGGWVGGQAPGAWGAGTLSRDPLLARC